MLFNEKPFNGLFIRFCSLTIILKSVYIFKFINFCIAKDFIAVRNEHEHWNNGEINVRMVPWSNYETIQNFWMKRNANLCHYLDEQ